MRTRSSLFPVIAVVLFGIGLVGITHPWLARAAESQPAANSTVSVVVQFSDTDRLIRKVEFSSSTISGLNALLNSGLDVVTKDMGWGIAVCSIEGVGCPASDCFCAFPKYWSYEYWDGSQWQSHSFGADTTNRSDGDIDGWRWGVWGGTPIVPYPQLERAWNALQWLKSQQNSDGGYGTPSSAASSSVESALAFGSNHEKAEDLKQSLSAPSLKDYLIANAGSNITNASTAGKTAVGTAKSGIPFQSGWNKPSHYYSQGIYQQGAGFQSWAILGALALGEQVPEQAIQYLMSLSSFDGGWEWSPGWGKDTNATAMAIQALIAAGKHPLTPEIQAGLTYLRSTQKDDGGFPYAENFGSDANSTAYVLQAIYAAAQDPRSALWTKNGKTAFDFLATVQLADGSFKWQSSETSGNLLATQQVIPALLGVPSALLTPEYIIYRNFLPLIYR